MGEVPLYCTSRGHVASMRLVPLKTNLGASSANTPTKIELNVSATDLLDALSRIVMHGALVLWCFGTLY